MQFSVNPKFSKPFVFTIFVKASSNDYVYGSVFIPMLHAGGSRIKYHIRVTNMFSRAAHQVTPEFPTNLRKIKKEQALRRQWFAGLRGE
jgi:hypothetical protein